MVRIPEHGSTNGGEGAAQEYEVRGDEVLRLSNGRLTTVYHYMRQQEKQTGEVEPLPTARAAKN
jgi:hypothetical protein